jgi:hypothetical protein
MLLMLCKPGTGFQARDGTQYIDDGSGLIEIADNHLSDAIHSGWRMVEDSTLVHVSQPVVVVDQPVSADSAEAADDEPEEDAARRGPGRPRKL